MSETLTKMTDLLGRCVGHQGRDWKEVVGSKVQLRAGVGI